MSMFSVFDISGSALSANSQRMNVTASNLANADSVAGPDGEPYHARQVMFQALSQQGGGTGGVRVTGVVEDDVTPMRMEYRPGHPLADELPLVNDRASARQALGLALDVPTLAVLPGSRGNEIRFQGEIFLRTAAALRERLGALQVAIPAASPERRQELDSLLERFPELAASTVVVEGRSREVMTASDAVLLTSGTAALETMLCHRPMVVAYRMAPATYWLARRRVKTRWISLPNLIAQETLVPELIQDAVTVDALVETPTARSDAT